MLVQVFHISTKYNNRKTDMSAPFPLISHALVLNTFFEALDTLVDITC